jgi:hypothetical protein
VAMLDVSLGQRKRLIAALTTLRGKHPLAVDQQADVQPGVADQPIGLLPAVDAALSGDPTQRAVQRGGNPHQQPPLHDAVAAVEIVRQTDVLRRAG